MSAPSTSARAAKSRKATPRGKQRREQKHDEIARMAAAEAASRAEERRQMIATAAYFLAQKRGFEPGHELDDWFAAESEVAHARQLESA